MSKVLHIREVPDDVHEALTRAAEAQGLSLTRFMLRELGQLAEREESARTNEQVIRRIQSRVRGDVHRETILSILDEGRGA